MRSEAKTPAVTSVKAMRVIFIFEYFFPPFDEGVKNLAYMIHSAVSEKNTTELIRDVSGLPHSLNSILILPRIIASALFLHPDKIIYIPKGALTFSGFIKSWVLEKLFGDRTSIVSVQKKQLTDRQASIVRHLQLRNVFALSNTMASGLGEYGVDAKTLFAGIDRDRFKPDANPGTLRKKYGISDSRPIVLHVGHIRASRNIEWLGQIQEEMPDLQVLLVGSTNTEQDLSLATELENKGVIIIRKALPDIQEIYQLSSWYCFPVMIQDAAMEIPLSVLEAMATNLPVITTRFGQLPELFNEDGHFQYVTSVDEIIMKLNNGLVEDCHNRKKTEPYTWQRTAELLLQ